MAYDNPLTITYLYDVIDYGATSGPYTDYLRGPKGMTGQVRLVSLLVTEAFLDDTLEAAIEVGTAADHDAYVKMNITDATAVNTIFDSSTHDTNAIIDAEIPKDLLTVITHTEGTDGSGVTGQGILTVVVDWS